MLNTLVFSISITKYQKYIHQKDYTIACHNSGKQYNSVSWSQWIEKISLTHSTLNFLIGSSEGLPKEILSSVNQVLSFSSFTFAHRIFRLILLEQIYRAFSIINHTPYHK